jgi:hypothetical protein
VTSWRAVSRRRMLTVMLGSSALAVTACQEPAGLRKPPGLSASVRTLRASITAEQGLVDSYHDVIRRFPQLSGRLNSFLVQHEQHLAQLRGRLVVPPHVTMSPIPSPAASGPAAGSAQSAVELLVRAEQTAAATQLGRLKDAPPALAQLLASIAASEATHAAALTSGGS